MNSVPKDFYNNKWFPMVISGLAICIFSFGIVIYMTANGQEVNRTEEASRQAKEILCKEYNFEYCEGQGVNNNTNSTNSTTKPQLECFSLGDIFDPYYERTRCRLS